MYTSKPGTSRFLIPMIGSETARAIASMFGPWFARIPTAPAISAQRAKAASIAGESIGLPGAAWQDTTRPPRIESRSGFMALPHNVRADDGPPTTDHRRQTTAPEDHRPQAGRGWF